MYIFEIATTEKTFTLLETQQQEMIKLLKELKNEPVIVLAKEVPVEACPCCGMMIE